MVYEIPIILTFVFLSWLGMAIKVTDKHLDKKDKWYNKVQTIISTILFAPLLYWVDDMVKN